MDQVATLEAPTIDPERAAALRQLMTSLVTSALDRVLRDLAAGASTASFSERALLATMRPFLPQLRVVLLSKLSEANPAGIEAVMGAVSTAIESILYHAPGTPLPRQRFDWDEAGQLRLVPLEALDVITDANGDELEHGNPDA